MWFDNGKLVFISFTNQQMENQSRPSLAMFISDDKISSTNIDEFLASFDPDKYLALRHSGRGRRRGKGRARRTRGQ
ncbi:hypothetical protein COH47_12405 [Neisseria meningitidis]|nr:hypothetical protein COH47_12405 [Neisseria meningitidis]